MKQQLGHAVSGGEDVCSGQFENEARSDGGVVFDADAATVFGDDARRDGKTKTSSAVLGREMREEEFVLILRRDAVTGVRDDYFNGVEIRLGASFNGDGSNRGRFKSFGRVVDEIDDDAAEQSGISANRGRVRGECATESDTVEAVGENLDGFANDAVDVGRLEFGGREADELGELVDQGGEGADFAFDQTGRFSDQTSELGILWRFGPGGVALFEVAG